MSRRVGPRCSRCKFARAGYYAAFNALWWAAEGTKAHPWDYVHIFVAVRDLLACTHKRRKHRNMAINLLAYYGSLRTRGKFSPPGWLQYDAEEAWRLIEEPCK